MDTTFTCNCSDEKIEKMLISLGKEELQSMIDDGETIEVNCHFCNSKYHVPVEKLQSLLKLAL